MIIIKNLDKYAKKKQFIYYGKRHEIKPMTVRAFCLLEENIELSDREFIELFCPTLDKVMQEDLKRVTEDLKALLYSGVKNEKVPDRNSGPVKDNTEIRLDLKYAITKVMYDYKVYTFDQILDLEFDVFMDLFFMTDVFKDEKQILIMEAVRTLHFEPSKDIFNNFKEALDIKRKRVSSFLKVLNTDLTELKNRYKGR